MEKLKTGQVCMLMSSNSLLKNKLLLVMETRRVILKPPSFNSLKRMRLSLAKLVLMGVKAVELRDKPLRKLSSSRKTRQLRPRMLRTRIGVLMPPSKTSSTHPKGQFTVKELIWRRRMRGLRDSSILKVRLAETQLTSIDLSWVLSTSTWRETLQLFRKTQM